MGWWRRSRVGRFTRNFAFFHGCMARGGSEREPSGLVQGLCIQLGVCGPLGLENGFLKAKNKLDDMIKKKVVI